MVYCFLSGSMVKNLPANAGDACSIPGSERSPGEGNGNPLQYSCLENPLNRGAWWATVHGVARVRHDLVTEQQNNNDVLQIETQQNLSLGIQECVFWKSFISTT